MSTYSCTTKVGKLNRLKCAVFVKKSLYKADLFGNVYLCQISDHKEILCSLSQHSAAFEERWGC